jgi:hypothetical protein
MLLRPGLLVDLEGDWRIYEAQRVPGRKDVIRVGQHLYNDRFEPVSPGAPTVVDAIDGNSGWKQHKKGRDAKLKQWEDRMARGRAEEARAKLLASAEGWKHDRPLSAFPREGFLKITCIRCGRVRFDQVGRVCGEARLGKLTVAQLQAVEYCYGCHDAVRIDWEN